MRWANSVKMQPEEYDAWYDTPRGRWIGETEFRLLFRLLKSQPNESLLDIGCGTGWFARRFSCMAGLDVTGLDSDAEWLEYARCRNENVQYVEGDGQHLPFPDASFDQVVSVAALCFIPDWAQALTEIVRVARTRFAVGMLNRHSLLWLSKGRDGGIGAYRGAHWHTRAELCTALGGLAVSNVRFHTAIFLPSGSGIARAAECLLPNTLSSGGLLIVSGTVVRQSA